MFKKTKNQFSKALIFTFLLTGCAAVQRDCSSFGAENFGADWVVVQLDLNGQPFRCWALHKTSITNEQGSDGIWWRAPGGNLVHISGLYNRVQVNNNNWSAAYHEVGITQETCSAISNHILTPSHAVPEEVNPVENQEEVRDE